MAIKAVVVADAEARGHRAASVIRHCAKHLEDFMVPKSSNSATSCPRPTPARSAAGWSGRSSWRLRHDALVLQVRDQAFSADDARNSMPRPRPSGSPPRCGARCSATSASAALVLGLSGGIDSSVSAALAVARLRQQNGCWRCSCPSAIPIRESLRLGRHGRRVRYGVEIGYRGHRARRSTPRAATSGATPSSASSCRNSATAGAARWRSPTRCRRGLQPHLAGRAVARRRARRQHRMPLGRLSRRSSPRPT